MPRALQRPAMDTFSSGSPVSSRVVTPPIFVDFSVKFSTNSGGNWYFHRRFFVAFVAFD